MKVLRKLTLRNLRLNKTRTIVTIIGIILSTALITAVAGVAASGQQTLFNAAIQRSGDYDLNIVGDFDSKTSQKLLSNRDVTAAYEQNIVGTAEFDSRSKYKPYVRVVGVSKNAFESCFKTKLSEGRYPENADELVLSPLFVTYSDKNYKVGDTIALNIGERWEKDKVNPDNIPNEADSGMLYWIHHANDYNADQEEFIGEFTKEYRIVGILEDAAALGYESYGGSIDIFTAADLSANAEHSAYYKYSKIYLNFTGRAERDYAKTTSEIVGIDEKYVNGITDSDLDDEETDKANEQLEHANYGINYFYINEEVLHYKGLALNDNNTRILYGIAVSVILIILVSSVFIIRNSFAISVTEKTKLYGMLSSIGATPRQIRRNVLLEGFILGAVGIPIGIVSGVGATALLILLCNTMLSEMLGNQTIAFCVSWTAILAAAVFGILTIFFSTISLSIRASRIAPIEAIRSSNDVKISGKGKAKSYRTPKLISKLFGTGGSIAWKNLKRSKKKYRTTVISIVLSVTVFISIFSLVQSIIKYSGKYYYDVEYNLSIYDGVAPNIFSRVAELDEVNKAVLARYEVNCSYYTDKSRLVDGIEKLSTGEWDNEQDFREFALTDDGKVLLNTLKYITFDENTYRDIINKLGYKYEDVKDKGIIGNYTYIFDKYGHATEKTTKLFASAKGMTIEAHCPVDDENGNSNGDDVETDIEIGGEYSPSELDSNLFGSGSIIVSPEWYKRNISDNDSIQSDMSQILINTSDADKTEAKLIELSQAYTEAPYIRNNDKEARMMNSFSLLIQIFVYGFILVISLIGLTNIFNTITTNMRLRSKEFAMLRSVGMTNNEFNRMVRLESLFYGARALLIGIPLGVLGGYGMYKIFEDNFGEITYSFPWLAIVISVIAVMLVVWSIMRFSIGKVRKQNIIETIRNDNI